MKASGYRMYHYDMLCWAAGWGLKCSSLPKNWCGWRGRGIWKRRCLRQPAESYQRCVAARWWNTSALNGSCLHLKENCAQHSAGNGMHANATHRVSFRLPQLCNPTAKFPLARRWIQVPNADGQLHHHLRLHREIVTKRIWLLGNIQV